MVLLLLLPLLSWLSLLVSLSGATSVVTVGFDHVGRKIITQLSLQVVTNPVLDPSCPLSIPAWELLAELCQDGADLIRFVPWFPFPYYGVPEIVKGTWNFTCVNPQMMAFLNATRGRRRVLNFSTQPAWAYNSSSSLPSSSDPRAVDYGYANGIPLPNTTEVLADYYGRLASWMGRGYFFDESGRNITGGPALGPDFSHWEVFNEPLGAGNLVGCHGLTPQTYVDQWDAITQAMQSNVDHPLKFVGLALQSPFPKDSLVWVQTFLNHSNHKATGAPIDYLSIHLYANAGAASGSALSDMFSQSDDAFTSTIEEIWRLKEALSPKTKISFDEVGTILGNSNVYVVPALYYKASGAHFAYVTMRLVELGASMVGMSQLAGSPPLANGCAIDFQYPDVSMFDWTTGKGNARAAILKILLKAELGPGAQMVKTSVSPSGAPIAALAFLSRSKRHRRLLLVNKDFRPSNVTCISGPHHISTILEPFDVKVLEF